MNSENIIKKKGWKYIEVDNSFKIAQENLSKFKENLFSKVFGTNSNLNNPYSDEILKSSLRSLLRYSSYSLDLLKLITKNFNNNIKFQDYYINLPYFLIHMSGDTNEIGDLHTDKIKECGESFTSWTSINDFDLNYDALTLYENTNNQIDLIILKILSKLKQTKMLKLYFNFFNKSEINISANKYTSLIWSSDLIHIGNLNTGSQKHFAMTFKISEFPHLYEKSFKISDISKINEFSDNIEIIKLANYLFNIDKLIENNLHNTKNIKLILQKFQNELENYPKEYHKLISFSSSLISQRFNLKLNMIEKSHLYDLISIVFGEENLMSFERVLKFYKKKNEKIILLNNLKKFTKIDMQRNSRILKRFNINF